MTAGGQGKYIGFHIMLTTCMEVGTGNGNSADEGDDHSNGFIWTDDLMVDYTMRNSADGEPSD